MSCNVIVVDAYDSFVHILVAYLEKIGCIVDLYRKDDPKLLKAINKQNGEMILLGPGPGHPAESGYSQLLDLNSGRLPVLGVCLGHQAIGLYYGAQVQYAKNLMHGKCSHISHDGLGSFRSYGDQKFLGMRYHSIILSDIDMPTCLKISARSDDDHYVMGVRHETLKIEGIQFHPESIGTPGGIHILENFIDSYVT